MALYVIGSVLMFAMKVKDLGLYAFSPLVSIAMLGAMTLATYLYAWNPLAVSSLLLCCVLLVFLARAAIERGKVAQSVNDQLQTLVKRVRCLRPAKSLSILFGVLASLIVATYVFASISLDSPIGVQNYDNPFHFSVVRHILKTGVASPIGAGSVMGSEHATYPSLWHAFVAMNVMVFGTSITESAWVISILFVGPLASIGTVSLTKAIFKNPNVLTLFLAAVLPVIMSRSLFSYIAYGSLFANVAGLALVPLALAWVVHLQRHATDSGVLVRAIAVIAACFASILALGLAQPSTVFILFLFLVPFWVASVRKAWAKACMLAGAVGCWLLFFNSPFFYRTIYCMDRVDADVDMGAALLSRIGISYSNLATIDLLPVLVFATCIVAGLLIAFLLRRKFSSGWFIVSLAFVFGQLLCSLFPENWFSIVLTGFWYRDYPRFLITLLFMGTCMIAYVPSLCELFLNRVTAVDGHPYAKASIVVAVSIACMVAAYHGNSYRQALHVESTANALSAQEILFMEQVAEIAGDAVVLNNADDNSVWMYPSYGINALIKGRPANQMSSMPDDICILIEGIDRIGEDSDYGDQVRRAAYGLNLSYVVKMSDKPGVTMRFTRQDKIDYRWSDAITKVNPSTNGLELVYELDGMQLYMLAFV